MEARQRPQEASLGDLFTRLTQDMSRLIRQEVQLARREVTDKATDIGKNIGMLAAGGAVAYGGYLFLLGALVYGLISLFALPVWLSFLIVGVLAAVVGFILIQRGIDALKRTQLTPQQTVDTLKEDVAWAKDQTT
ncbi:MAG TPA: phage holin family protein [Ktedonobacterales bacterium]|nr:phage holin family protein [Ktedonobacterales bacterium]